MTQVFLDTWVFLFSKMIFLSVEVSFGADADSMEDFYSVFKREAKDLSSNYKPNVMGTDAWTTTQNA
ncbi:MAG: hypothetical protein ACPGVB_05205 [Chitinophagales bacterium]